MPDRLSLLDGELARKVAQQIIHVPESFDPGARVLRRGRIAKIGGQDLNIDIRRFPETFSHLLQLPRVAGHKAKMHALSCKFSRDGRADSPIGTGYQCNFSV